MPTIVAIIASTKKRTKTTPHRSLNQLASAGEGKAIKTSLKLGILKSKYAKSETTDFSLLDS